MNFYFYLIPYMIQLIVFWAWSNFILKMRAKGDYENTNAVAVGLLVIVGLFKLIIELIQFIGGVRIQAQPWKFWKNDYLSELKNWLELVGTGLILYNCFRSTQEKGNDLQEDTFFWKC